MQNDDDRRRRPEQDDWRRRQARQSEQNRGYGDDRYAEGRNSSERERGRDLYAEGYGEQRYEDPSWREWQPSESEEWRVRGARSQDDRSAESRYSRGDDYRQDQRRSERYSPDWSRRDSEPLYSGDPYYSRNRRFNEQDERGEYRARGAGARGEDSRRFSGEGGERMRYAEQSRGERGAHDERSAENERYYRGYYGRSWSPYSYPGGRGNVFVESWVLTGPHTGRGPKGYKRSDQQIVEDACQRLERDGHIDATDIEVSAENGVIELTGTVNDRETKRRAEECVESVYGVHDVMNRLSVRREQSGQSGQSASSSRSSMGKQSRGATSRASGSESDGGSGEIPHPTAAGEQEKKGSRPSAGKEQH